jgi:hypothetical protein
MRDPGHLDRRMISDGARVGSIVSGLCPMTFRGKCIAGIPVETVEMPSVSRRIEMAPHLGAVTIFRRQENLSQNAQIRS